MPDRNIVRLLLLEDSQNEAERLVSLFRNAGHATRVHRLTSEQDLNEALQQPWDLLIAAPTSENLDPYTALAAIQKQAKDISFIQLLDEDDFELVEEALANGAKDAVLKTRNQHLLLVARRELADLRTRRQLRQIEVALREAEKRCQLLLDSSMDAITYVHDGMHIYANRSYMNLFNFESIEDLEGLPMVDVIDSQDQSTFKDFLRHYSKDASNTDITCNVSKSTGEKMKVTMSFSPAHYDGEPCIQVVMRTVQDDAKLKERLKEATSKDPTTGLYNRSYFLELLDQYVERAIKNSEQSTLAYLYVDRYDEIFQEVGISGFDTVLKQLTTVFQNELGESARLSRFGDDSFTFILPQKTPEQSQVILEKVLQKIANTLIQVDNKSVQATLSVGIAGINETTSKADIVIERAHRCADSLKDGNSIKLYDPAEELAQAASRGNMEAIVRHALDTQDISLLFQPVVSLRGEATELYDLTFNIINDKGDALTRTELYPAAEQAGCATRLDRWILLNAIKRLTVEYSEGHRTRLFLPISNSSLQDKTLPTWLGMALKAAHLPASALIIKIPEPDAITYLQQTQELAKALHAMGIEVMLSYFGGALNPFNTFKFLDVDFVRLDPDLFEVLEPEEKLEKITDMLNHIHALKKRSIISHVDSATALAPLWQAGVNFIQGEYLQAPTPNMNYVFASEE